MQSPVGYPCRARFGSQVTIIEMLPALIPREDSAASNELAKHFRMRGITLHLGRQCTKVKDSGSELTVHFGDGETVMADLTVPHFYAVGDCAGHWQLAHTAFREGEVAARNASGYQAIVGNRLDRGRTARDRHG